jgi:hypothetical protein
VSLCSEDAVAGFRVFVQPLAEFSPELIILSSDGYANSFRSDGGFLKIGGDLLEIIREEGIAAVENNLERWLQEASECGSGDDITLALLWRSPAEEEIGA